MKKFRTRTKILNSKLMLHLHLSLHPSSLNPPFDFLPRFIVNIFWNSINIVVNVRLQIQLIDIFVMWGLSMSSFEPPSLPEKEELDEEELDDENDDRDLDSSLSSAAFSPGDDS